MRMLKVRKSLWWLMPFVVMALIAGCGGDEEAAPQSKATTAPQPTATTAPQPTATTAP